jgi:membrane protease subunit (stomatin/prohibitin family)
MMRRRGPGLIRTAARTAVIAGTATAVSGNVMRRQQRKAMEEYQQQGGQVAPAQEAQQAPASGGEDYVAELEKLAKLKDQGIITEADFEAKKKQILGI